LAESPPLREAPNGQGPIIQKPFRVVGGSIGSYKKDGKTYYYRDDKVYRVPMDGFWRLHVNDSAFSFSLSPADHVPKTITVQPFRRIWDVNPRQNANAQWIDDNDTAPSAPITDTKLPLDKSRLTDIQRLDLNGDGKAEEPVLEGGQWLLHSLNMGGGAVLQFDPNNQASLLLDGSTRNDTEPMQQTAIAMQGGTHLRGVGPPIQIYPGLAPTSKLFEINATAKRDGEVITAADLAEAGNFWQIADLPAGGETNLDGYILADNVVLRSNARIVMPTGFKPTEGGTNGAAQKAEVRYWGYNPHPASP
jgi:hypothetical protein